MVVGECGLLLGTESVGGRCVIDGLMMRSRIEFIQIATSVSCMIDRK